MDDAELHPDDLGPYFYRLVDKRRNPIDALEQINDIDRRRDILEVGITFLPENLVVLRVHRDYLESMIEQILRGKVTRARPVGGKSDYGHALVISEYAA